LSAAAANDEQLEEQQHFTIITTDNDNQADALPNNSNPVAIVRLPSAVCPPLTQHVSLVFPVHPVPNSSDGT
jgi:hypothetical protein